MEEDVQEDDNLEKLFKLLQAADPRLNEDSPASWSSSPVTAVSLRSKDLLQQNQASFGKNIMDVSSKDANVDIYYPTLTS